jgi:hypothetical protein
MPSQEVCAANAVTHYQGLQACVSSCTFIPEVEPNMMICAIEDDTDLANVKPGGSNVNGDLGKRYTWCSVVHTFFAVLSLCLSTSFPAVFCGFKFVFVNLFSCFFAVLSLCLSTSFPAKMIFDDSTQV